MAASSKFNPRSAIVLSRFAGSPSANLDASALYQRAPENYIIPPPLAGHRFWTGQAGASLNWDLDFWGRQADAVHRAQALTHAANLDVDNARLMLAGAITQAYVELYREYAFADITRRRVAAGLDTQLEMRQAQGQLPQTRVARDQANAAADLAVHQLAALTGQGAASYASIQRPTFKVDAALPVPTSLPINLLARRPDVLSARFTVQAADAQRLASYLAVLNAETQVLTARQSMVDIFASQAVARVTLLLAVGGSFDPHAESNVVAAGQSKISDRILTQVTP